MLTISIIKLVPRLRSDHPSKPGTDWLSLAALIGGGLTGGVSIVYGVSRFCSLNYLRNGSYGNILKKNTWRGMRRTDYHRAKGN